MHQPTIEKFIEKFKLNIKFPSRSSIADTMVSISIEVDQNEGRSRSRSPMETLVRALREDLTISWNRWNSSSNWCWHISTHRWWLWNNQEWYTLWSRGWNDHNGFSWKEWQEKWGNEKKKDEEEMDTK